MKDLADLKVAIVCDWLTGVGGAERVVLELHKLFPGAPIYTSQYDPKAIDWFDGADVRTTWLQKLPKSLKKFLPVFRAWAFSHLNLSEYDLVISETGAEAKSVKIGPNTTHICICNTPTHYYWSRYESYLKNPGFGKLDFLARFGLKLFVAPMRRWDYRAAQKPTYLVAISTHIQNMIKKYYDRESTVIFPPVNTERFTKPADTRSGFIITGRQTPYKRIDLAVAACTKLGLPLTVIGTGPEHDKLVKMAGPTITFDTNASDKDVANYMSQASGFIFPGVDDFGIVAVEAMAAGTPVIAYKAGGALDYVIGHKTGLFFTEQTVDSLSQVLARFDGSKFKAPEIIKHAQTFNAEHFRQNLTNFINQKLVELTK